MSTPTYLGGAQPAPSVGNGLLGRIGSYLSGSGTPAYIGAGQPAPMNNGGLLRPATPTYAAAPVRAPLVDAEIAEVAPVEQSADETNATGATTACPIDPAALAAGHIAIVIPRK